MFFLKWLIQVLFSCLNCFQFFQCLLVFKSTERTDTDASMYNVYSESGSATLEQKVLITANGIYVLTYSVAEAQLIL